MGRTLFARHLNIDKGQLERTELGRSDARDDIIETVARHYPQYAYWLVTGMTQPEAGNIGPAIEKQRKELDVRGKAG